MLYGDPLPVSHTPQHSLSALVLTHPLPGGRCWACHTACSRGPQLEGFVVTSLIQLLCRTTKLGWFDDDAYRTVVDDAQKLLEKGTQVGLPCSQG